jgi:hypothetical protein
MQKLGVFSNLINPKKEKTVTTFDILTPFTSQT